MDIGASEIGGDAPGRGLASKARPGFRRGERCLWPVRPRRALGEEDRVGLVILRPAQPGRGEQDERGQDQETDFN